MQNNGGPRRSDALAPYRSRTHHKPTPPAETLRAAAANAELEENEDD